MPEEDPSTCLLFTSKRSKTVEMEGFGDKLKSLKGLCLKNKSVLAYIFIVLLLIVIIITGICNQSHESHYHKRGQVASQQSGLHSSQYSQIQGDKNDQGYIDPLESYQNKHGKWSGDKDSKKPYLMTTPPPLATTRVWTTVRYVTSPPTTLPTTSTTSKKKWTTPEFKTRPPVSISSSGTFGFPVCSKSKAFKSCLLSLTRYPLDPELSNFCPTHNTNHEGTIISTLKSLIEKFTLKNRERNLGLWSCLTRMGAEDSSGKSLKFAFEAVIDAIGRFNNKQVFPFATRINSEYGIKSAEYRNLPEYLQWIANGTEVRIAYLDASVQQGHGGHLGIRGQSRLFYFYQKSTQARDRDRFAWALRSSPHFQPGNRIFSFKFEPSENGGGNGGAGMYIRNTRYDDFVVMDIENENLIFSQSHMPFEIVWVAENLFQLVFGNRAFAAERLDTANVTARSEWEHIENYKFRRGRFTQPANFILEKFN